MKIKNDWNFDNLIVFGLIWLIIFAFVFMIMTIINIDLKDMTKREVLLINKEIECRNTNILQTKDYYLNLYFEDKR